MKNYSNTIIIKSNKIIQNRKGANNLTIVDFNYKAKIKQLQKQ